MSGSPDDLTITGRFRNEISRDVDPAVASIREVTSAVDESGDTARTAASRWQQLTTRITGTGTGAEKAGTLIGKAVVLGIKPWQLAARGAITVTQKLATTAADAGRKFGRNLVAGLRDAKGAGDRFKSAAAGGFGLKTLITGNLVSQGIGQLIGYGKQGIAAGLQVAAGAEQSQVAFETMLGSGAKAQKFLKQLSDFAAKTPFDLPGLTQSASSLISAGIDANKVIPIMTSLGNATSGMGTGAEGVQRATVAIQQMTAAQKISGEDLNQLRDAGIPVYDLLAKATGKSKKEIVDLAQAGKLGKKELDAMMSALASGKGLERFDGLMDKQSTTLTGLWSTLKDTLGQGLAKAIAPGIPAIKRGLGGAISFITKGSQWIAKNAPLIGPKIKAGFDKVKRSPAFQSILRLVQAIATAVTGQLIPSAKRLWKAFGPSAKDAGDTMQAFADKVWSLADFINNHAGPAIKTVTDFLINNKAAVQGFFAVIGGAIVVMKAFRLAQLAINLAMAANPIGLVIVAIAALVAGVIWARNRFDWFRKLTDTVWFGLKIGALQMAIIVISGFKMLLNVWTTVVSKLLRGAAKVASALGMDGLAKKLNGAAAHVEGFKDDANRSLDKVKKDLQIKLDTAIAKQQADALAEKIRKMRPTMSVRVSTTSNYDPTQHGPGPSDTKTSRSRTRAWGLSDTLAAHRQASASLGGGYRITNLLTGGGGRGHGSGDHQSGRAADVVGNNLGGYVKAVQARGGFAEIHGSGGEGRHAHAVYGDTKTSRASGPDSPAVVLTVAPGAIVVQEARNPMETAKAIRRELAAMITEAQERA